MQNATNTPSGYTKKYHIPLSHLDPSYIEKCVDREELAQIHEELMNATEYSYGESEHFAHERTLADDQTSKNNNASSVQQIEFRNQSEPSKRIAVPSAVTIENQSDFLSESVESFAYNVAILRSLEDSKLQQITLKSCAEWEEFQKEVKQDFIDDDETEGILNCNRKPNIDNDEHYALGIGALKHSEFQQAIDHFGNSISDNKDNLNALMGRAIAYYYAKDLRNCLADCSYVIDIEPDSEKALLCRASARYDLGRFDTAKTDVERVLQINPNSKAACHLSELISSAKQTNTGNNSDDEVNKNKFLIGKSTDYMLWHRSSEESSVDEMSPLIGEASQKQGFLSILSNQTSEIWQNQSKYKPPESSLNRGDDDDMPLGDEAGIVSGGDESEGDETAKHDLNVSPTSNQDFHSIKPTDPDVIEMVSIEENNTSKINNTMGTKTSLINLAQSFVNHKSGRQNDDDFDFCRSSNNKSSLRLTSNLNSDKSARHARNSLSNYDDQHTPSPTTARDAILKSGFGVTIQNWLLDFVASQSDSYYNSSYDRPWSKSLLPYSLEKIQTDIQKFYQYGEYQKATDISKKMLHNGMLDYHYYSEHIAETLFTCAKIHSKLGDLERAIQYATESLQYEKLSESVWICRAKAFQLDNCPLFSYSDYKRISQDHYDYDDIQLIIHELETELDSSEDKTWREKLSTDTNCDESYLAYIQLKSPYTVEGAYEWYRNRADQLYSDGCFILAILCYTSCIELEPKSTHPYLRRALCYLNVFEPQKSIADCDRILAEDQNNFDALYCKACATKVARNIPSYKSLLKKCLKLQPKNQILLNEYYSYSRDRVPRKRRRIRIHSIAANPTRNRISYEDLERIRLSSPIVDASLFSDDVNQQLSFLLHITEDDFEEAPHHSMIKLIEIFTRLCQIMVQAEQSYQQEHSSAELPFSYIKYFGTVLCRLAKMPDFRTTIESLDSDLETSLVTLSSLFSSFQFPMEDILALNSNGKL